MATNIPRKVVIVVTSHADLGESGRKTGFWFEELAAPYWKFRDAGFDVIIASPKGGIPPADPASLTAEFATDHVKRFRSDAEAQERLANTVSLANLGRAGNYSAIFLAGGHGTMWDFPDNIELGRLIADAAAHEVTVAAVCHGVSGLLNSRLAPVVSGRKLTGFSNDEETAVGLQNTVPFMLETRLNESGAVYFAAPPFNPYVVTDGWLVTGQNPVSSTAAAEAVIAITEEDEH